MSWSKEDRKIFNLSEVFRNMESKIIENYNKLDLAQKFAKVDQLAGTLDKANDSGKELMSSLEGINNQIGNASDHEVVDEIKNDNVRVTVSKNSAEDEESPVDEKYFEDQIEALSAMAYEAGISGNIKLAYKIERAIEEIKEAIDENKLGVKFQI